MAMGLTGTSAMMDTAFNLGTGGCKILGNALDGACTHIGRAARGVAKRSKVAQPKRARTARSQRGKTHPKSNAENVKARCQKQADKQRLLERERRIRWRRQNLPEVRKNMCIFKRLPDAAQKDILNRIKQEIENGQHTCTDGKESILQCLQYICRDEPHILVELCESTPRCVQYIVRRLGQETLRRHLIDLEQLSDDDREYIIEFSISAFDHNLKRKIVKQTKVKEYIRLLGDVSYYAKLRRYKVMPEEFSLIIEAVDFIAQCHDHLKKEGCLDSSGSEASTES